MLLRAPGCWTCGPWWPLVAVFGCAAPGVSPDTATPSVVAAPPGSVDLVPRACHDDRYPALAGAWAVGCSATGRVDLAVHLETGLRVALDEAVDSPGLADGALYAPGVGVWTLPNPTPVHVAPMVTDHPIAPPAFDGERVALLFADGVEVFALGDTVRKRIAARPLPWRAPALRWPDVAWQDAAGPTLRTVDGQLHHFAAGPDGPPVDRSVVSDAWRVLFTGPGASVWVDRRLRTEVTDPVDAGFDAPVALSGPVRCAETRPAPGVRCFGATLPDGVDLAGHDHPSVAGPWLLTRTDAHTWLTSFAALGLARGDLVDRDPHPTRAPGDCTGDAAVWDLDWPASGWEIAFLTNDRQEGVRPLTPGRKVLTWPCAQAATLRPARAG